MRTLHTVSRHHILVRSSIAIVSAVGLLFLTLGRADFAQSQDTGSPVNVRALMQMKLESSQAVLRGLALDDHQLLAKESQKLQLLNLDASWNVVQTKEYARISAEFRDAAKKIHRAAEKKNLDAAGLGYFQLTMTCIDCHRHVRASTAQQ